MTNDPQRGRVEWRHGRELFVMPDGATYVRCKPAQDADLTFSFAGYNGALPLLRLRLFDAKRWDKRQARKVRKIVKRERARRKRRANGTQTVKAAGEA